MDPFEKYYRKDHSHCWDQKQPPACGIPLEKHNQCCLCDIKLSHMDYDTLLKNAPPQDSLEFIEYLGKHNNVVFENDRWIVIENAKYHKPDKPWLSAFTKKQTFSLDDFVQMLIKNGWDTWEWRKKAFNKQTVPGRFHIHIIRG